MKAVKFTPISQNEVKFEYKKIKFILAEKSQGVYGIGKAALLYQLDGVKTEFIKTIGWTRTDNHGGPSKEVMLPGIVTFEACKQPALKYVQSLLD
jgi:hypothetical protein